MVRPVIPVGSSVTAGRECMWGSATTLYQLVYPYETDGERVSILVVIC